jgi:AAA ATPase domain
VELIRRQAPDWLVHLPWLSEGSETGPDAPRADRNARERMLLQMAGAVEAISMHRPLVLVIEDLHWADYSTLDLLSLLATRPDPACLLVVVTYRPAEAVVRAHAVAAVHRDLHRRGVITDIPLGLAWTCSPGCRPGSTHAVTSFCCRRRSDRC